MDMLDKMSNYDIFSPILPNRRIGLVIAVFV
jgi:hypothetical protein